MIATVVAALRRTAGDMLTVAHPTPAGLGDVLEARAGGSAVAYTCAWQALYEHLGQPLDEWLTPERTGRELAAALSAAADRVADDPEFRRVVGSTTGAALDIVAAVLDAAR